MVQTMKNNGKCAIKRFVSILGVMAMLALGSTHLQAAPASNKPIFIPTSAWLVGPASLTALAEAKPPVPCLMANQYDNGYMVRLSGGAQRILAIAIDFRQNVFNPGQTYDVGVGIGEAFSKMVAATAYNEAVLILNTTGAEGLYQALSTGKTLLLSVGQKEFEFVLLGVDEGLRRLEACYNGTSATTSSGLPDGTPAAKPMNTISGPAPSTTPALQQATNMPQDALPMMEPQVEAQPQPNGGGMTMDMIMKSAVGNIEGMQTRKAVPEDQVQNITNGDAPKAPPAGKPLAQNWMPQKSADAKMDAVPRDIFVPTRRDAQGNGAIPSAERRWRAVKGVNLQEVLDTWVANENAELLWVSNRDFLVQDSFTLSGTFEQAVEGLLSQYNELPKRPVGKIYNDPGMQKKILLIELDEKK